ncbi:unnamed protein product [Alopecurus aequalis]
MDGGGSATSFSRTTTTTTPSTSQGESRQGDRAAAIDAEMARVNKLPANSSYAIHRMKVLSKLRHLISIKVRRLCPPIDHRWLEPCGFLSGSVRSSFPEQGVTCHILLHSAEMTLLMASIYLSLLRLSWNIMICRILYLVFP